METSNGKSLKSRRSVSPIRRHQSSNSLPAHTAGLTPQASEDWRIKPFASGGMRSNPSANGLLGGRVMTSPETHKPASASSAGDLHQRKQEYEFHPIANVFPLMKGEEFKQFKNDIRSNKLREQIIIYEGKILDGRNRYNACKELGLPVDTRPLPAGTDPVAFVVSANVHRRHLNETQRAAVAAELATFTHGGDRSKAPIGALTDAAAAKLLNVGERSVERAKAVLNQATPNIQALVKSGEVAVSAATEVVKLPKEKQAELTTASKVREAVKQAKQAKEEAEKK